MPKDLTGLIKALARRIRGHRYKPPRRAKKQLPADATEMIRMPIDAVGADRPNGELYKTWGQIHGGHKWWHYFPIYEGILQPLRNRPVRILEIGIFQGGSLSMWRNYLHKDSLIVGIDIEPSCDRFENVAANVHVRIGDQSDTGFLQKVFSEFGPFDVILDDGSHVCSHMIKTFGYAFLHGLCDRGTYIAEDTHSNFWRRYRDQSYSFVDLCKDLVDLSHEHYLGTGHIGAYSSENPVPSRAASITRIGAQIEEIRFVDSMVILTRKARRVMPTVEYVRKPRPPEEPPVLHDRSSIGAAD